MTDQHPITPPPELVEEWCSQLFGCDEKPEIVAYELAHWAARWGADQELEACCEWLKKDPDAYELVGLNAVYLDLNLYAARRPKPPSLKEQALALLDKIQGSKAAWDISDLNVVRRALEQLND